MTKTSRPEWVDNLPAEDLAFIKSFLLASGSLKAVAAEYGVSYPTLRIRLDHLIERLKRADDGPIDPFHARLKTLVADGEVELSVARELLDLYRNRNREQT